MVKRIVFIAISLILACSLTVGSAEFFFGPKYRVSSNLNEAFIDETLSGNYFKYLENYTSDISEQLGYFPNYEVDYDKEVITFWLYNSVVEVKCVLVDDDKKVIVPAIQLDEALVGYNELFSTLINRAYKLNEIESEKFVIDQIVDKDDELQLFVYSVADDAYFKLLAHEYTIYDGEYYVSPSEFRQLWFEIYRHNPNRIFVAQDFQDL